MGLAAAQSQVPVAAPVKQSADKPAESPAQIELLETKYRFETNGDSRKEVHARVKINSELGARQFARLNFDYSRSFQQVEIPLARITHPSGGTVDILPSAITDNPNPAVVNAPAYQDVRVKSVRILGLGPGDFLEYRVITTVTKSPFAPNFYLAHDFATGGVVTQELFEVDVPADHPVKPFTSASARSFESTSSGAVLTARTIYRWSRRESDLPGQAEPSLKMAAVQDLPIFSESDVVLGSMSWMDLLKELQNKFDTTGVSPAEIKAKAQALTHGAVTDEDKIRELYEFVAHKLVTVDLPLGSTGFQLRAPVEILSSSYAIPEEKCSLLSALAGSIGLNAKPALTGINETAKRGPAAPSLLTNILIVARLGAATRWLDPSAEVAPFGVVAANLRGRPALVLHPPTDIDAFETVPNALPFAASQTVTVDAALSADGNLQAKVSYRLRGDNELLLREAFHQTPQEKWKEVAQLLALSDGFRGQVTNVKASDPSATREPFIVEYEVTQPKFVDWSKKPVRIPTILPLVGLPDSPAKPAPGAAASPIELGTPLDVEMTATLRLPSGTTIETPTGTSVERDYATFASKYSIREGVITASRHIRFLLRELPATRAADYNAFLHAVQNDQAQLFTLDRSSTNSTKPSPLNPAPKRP